MKTFTINLRQTINGVGQNTNVTSYIRLERKT